jgi:phosphatidylserine decarboxylase|tara:strand:+ start:39234 stop:39881 length:648 start_codon:yes stop_codon:yes gene_type:complete
MKIHKEGRKIIIAEILLILCLYILSSNYFSIITTKVILIISIFVLLSTLYFFRIIKRNFNRDENIVYAPCDGKIVVIENTLENEYYNEIKLQVSIFMSPLNMHNNLYPLQGKVKYKKYHPGKFLFAWNPKSSTDNERSTIVIENNKISILVRQIAGALARRIITYGKINENVKSCDELGFIKFGSRVDLFLPKNTKLNIKLNDKVVGGKTIIAKY